MAQSDVRSYTVQARSTDTFGRVLCTARNHLGFSAPVPFGPFIGVETGNEVTLDFMDTDGEIAPQHYAFLISDKELVEILARIRARKLPYWADPAKETLSQINTRDGGRGIYFEDPNGHLLEILTRPYGSGG